MATDQPAGTARRCWTTAAPAAFVLLWSTGFIGAKLGLPYAEPGRTTSTSMPIG